MKRTQSKPDVLAVIIGRAGSKGLPGKNAMILFGKPTICHTIEDAKAARCVNRVIVSTDGDEIAVAARSLEVDVVRRPPELASDTAPIDAAVRHAVKSIGDHSPIVVILYANVPVRPDDLIDRAVNELIASGADSVQSYGDVGKHHPYWMVTLDAQQRVQPHVQNTVYRRQDLPKLYLPDGGVIAVTRNSLSKEVASQPHAFLGTNRRGIISPLGSVIDIDTLVDFRVAEAFFAENAQKAQKPPATDASTPILMGAHR